MPNDTKTYDYNALEELIARMKRISEDAGQKAADLKSATQRIMAGWEGATAVEYDNQSNGFQQDIVTAQGNVEQLSTKVNDAKNAVYDADKSGGKGIQTR